MIRLAQAWSGQLDALLHPCAQTDSLEAPRHRIFLSGCFLTAAAGMVLLPLHLALSPGLNLVLVAASAWALAHLPLALYLSQTGRLARAYGMSSMIFAVFLTAVAWLTGGLSSFALVWLAVVPMEAALSGSRRIILASAGLCLAVLCALAVLPAAPASLLHGFPGGYETLGTIVVATGASLYMIALALRLTLAHARQTKRAGEDRRRLADLSSMTRDVTCHLRADGNAEVVSGSIAALLEISPSRGRVVHGDWLFQRVLVGDRPAYLTALADAREGKALGDLTLRLRTGSAEPGEAGDSAIRSFRLTFHRRPAEGTERDAQVFVTLARAADLAADPANEPRDVPQARRAGSESAPFLATAAHELRTPLNAIIGFSDILRDRDGGIDPARQADYAELIHRSGRHLLQVVNDMLDSSALQSGARKLTIEPVDLGRVVDECVEMLAPIAAERSVILEPRTPSEWPVVAADAGALRQVFINLLGNAIKFSEPGRHVRFDCSVVEGEAQVAVIDQGCGIRAEDLAKLGTPFMRGNVPLSRRASGTDLPDPAGAGLGLSIARGLCDLHGGHLDLSSRPGQGTTARVCLPLGAPKQVGARRKAAPAGLATGQGLAAPVQASTQRLDEPSVGGLAAQAFAMARRMSAAVESSSAPQGPRTRGENGDYRKSA